MSYILTVFLISRLGGDGYIDTQIRYPDMTTCEQHKPAVTADAEHRRDTSRFVIKGVCAVAEDYQPPSAPVPSKVPSCGGGVSDDECKAE